MNRAHEIDFGGLKGPIGYDQPLAPVTWFRVGGPAEILFQPRDEEDLSIFLSRLPAEIPITIIGVGSNLLVRDGGIAGAVIRLGRDFNVINVSGTRVTAGAAALDVMVAREAQRAGVAGLEFMRGIPGTIGGGLRMNAGAYDREFKDVLKFVRALDRAGKVRELSLADMKFTYRNSGAPEDLVFISASFEGTPGKPAEILERMDEITAKREASQPIRSRTGGSTFKNPANGKAWELIDKAGCRGLKVGGAQVSEQHCNFLINTGTATAADLEALGEEVCRRVKETSGFDLEWEIKRLGRSREEIAALAGKQVTMISAIEINSEGELLVVPANGTFEHIYRSAMSVNWRKEINSLFFPAPKEWSYPRCFEQILNAVSGEYGIQLKISADTRWIAVPEDVKCQIRAISPP